MACTERVPGSMKRGSGFSRRLDEAAKGRCVRTGTK
jgi:hypothetical protein